MYTFQKTSRGRVVLIPRTVLFQDYRLSKMNKHHTCDIEHADSSMNLRLSATTALRASDENPTERAGISGINREIPIGPEKRYTGRPSPSIREPHFFLTFISPVNV